MRKTLLRVAALVAMTLLVLAPSAAGVRIQLGNLIVVADGGFSPKTLPKQRLAPIKLRGYSKMSTANGELPPALREIVLFFDRRGDVETRGLPVCAPGKLVATNSKEARRRCRGAIVGTGFGKGVIDFPEQAPFPASSPLTLFNGPRKNGNPTVLAHAYLSVPVPTAYIVPIEIERVRGGRYGLKTVAKIPKLAGGAGIPLYGRLRIGREWTHEGKRRSYANARCPDGRLQAKGSFGFADGTRLHGTFLQRCEGR